MRLLHRALIAVLIGAVDAIAIAAAVEVWRAIT
jgi:hypothetical protein